MGNFSKGICWPSNAQAVDAYFSSLAPFQTIGSFTTENIYTFDGSSWQLSQYSISSAGVRNLVYSTPAPSLSFPTCITPNDPDTLFTDGLTLGWGVAAAMVAAWGISYLTKRQLGIRV